MASLTKNWPVTASVLIGRQQDIEQASAALRRPDVRLLTLLGPAGVGKTRLALSVAETLSAAFPDGVAFVDLAPVTGPDGVLGAVAAAVGVTEGPAEPLPDQLRRYLEEKRLLLLLDNFEHVVVAAPMVAAFLTHCPRLKILATSRVPLDVSWEHRLPVPPLAVPSPDETRIETLAGTPAVSLFRARARAVSPQFEIDSLNAPAVAAICGRLDGLPLAIELAAAQIDVQSAQGVLAGLQASGLDVLMQETRDVPQRHQTLRAAIAGSERLLQPEEREVFMRLAVFAGGGTVNAAASVCETDKASAWRLLRSLARKNLLQVDSNGESPRFRMLEMVREYALEQLKESGRESDLRHLHANWCVSEAEQAEAELPNSGQVQWLDRVDAEMENLRSAMSWCLDTGNFVAGASIAAGLNRAWEVRHIVEGSRWLTIWLRCLGDAEEALRGRVLNALGILEIAQSKTADAFRHLELSVSLAARTSDRETEAIGLTHLALALAVLGNRERAWELLERSLESSREIGFHEGIRYSMYHMANMTRRRDGPERSFPLYEDAKALCREAGDIDLLRWALGNEGSAHESISNHQRAGELYREAFRLSLELRSPWGIVTYCYRLAGLAGLQGRHERAARLHGVAEVERQRHGIGYGINGRVLDLPDVRSALGDAVFYARQAEGRAMRFDEAVAYVLAEDSAWRAPGVLSKRQNEVLQLIAAGKTNREIADALVLSERTVQRHIADIYLKINVRNRAEAVNYARDRLLQG
jgi:non-specific serine/threonine protein kinase